MRHAAECHPQYTPQNKPHGMITFLTRSTQLTRCTTSTPQRPLPRSEANSEVHQEEPELSDRRFDVRMEHDPPTLDCENEPHQR